MRFPLSTLPAKAGIALAIAAWLSGCVGGGGSSGSGGPAAEPVDVRRFIGPSYCPELRVREGTEVLRRYEAGREDDPAAVVWQASISDTARECLYDGAGNLTLRIGVSGRVIAGPRGAPGVVSAPLRIAVVKYEEALLASQIYPLAIQIPPENSTLFSEVKEVTVASPGEARDYIIYVGFDDGQEVPIGNEIVAAPTVREQVLAGESLEGADLVGN